jgi:hypothetical protein
MRWAGNDANLRASVRQGVEPPLELLGEANGEHEPSVSMRIQKSGEPHSAKDPRNGSNSNLQAPPNHPGYGRIMAIDTQALGELDVQDVTGAAVRVGSAWAKGPAVLVFLRHFG